MIDHVIDPVGAFLIVHDSPKLGSSMKLQAPRQLAPLHGPRSSRHRIEAPDSVERFQEQS